METKTRRVSAAFFAAIAFIGNAAFAQDTPLSAIDWLSNSIDLPQEAVAQPPALPSENSSVDAPQIVVAPLDGPVPDRAGILPARDIGLSPSIWGASSATDLARLISALPSAETPALQRFTRDLLVAQFDPPVDALLDQSLYLARIDKLLDLGHLDDAQAVIEAGGAPEPQRFRRQFDIALLTGRETASCATMEATPEISPTVPARIFCLARNGAWDVAALTLGNSASLKLIDEDEEQLLLHFLDPDLFESEPLPAPPLHPTPLQFRLYEAVGERISTETLPVAFAFTDLTDTVGWKARLRSAERLAAAGAISSHTLWRVVSERKPAASGGIWERVRALQALRAALRTGTPTEIERALPPAWSAARISGFEAAIAPDIARQLDGVALSGAAAHVAFEIALLAGRPELAKTFADNTPEDRFLIAVATGNLSAAPPVDMLEQAVRRGLTAQGAGERFERLLESDQAGAALIEAILLISEGSSGDPDAVADALHLFRTLGLEDLAQQTAVELLLQEGAA